MVLGFVTEQKPNTRKKRLIKLFTKITCQMVENPENGFTLLIVELPVSEQLLKKMPAKRLKKLLDKALSIVKKQTDKVVFSNLLKKCCAKKNIPVIGPEPQKCKELLLKLAPQCVRTTAKNCGISLIDSVICIRDTKLDRISETLLRELCFDVNNVVLSTQNQVKAKALCDGFYEETGLFVRTFGEQKIRYDIIIDVDEGKIGFGRDLFVCEADLGYNLEGFEANHFEIAQMMNKKSFNKIRR